MATNKRTLEPAIDITANPDSKELRITVAYKGQYIHGIVPAWATDQKTSALRLCWDMIKTLTEQDVK